MLGGILNSVEPLIAVELVINHDDAKSFFWLLHDQKEEIDAKLGIMMDWRELPDRKSSKLFYSLPDSDPLDVNRWTEYQEWMKTNLERMKEVFAPYVKALDASDWVPETSGDEDA